MRFLADESCDFGIVQALRAAGHEVLAVAEVTPRAEDPAVIDLAVREGRVLLTEDKDFGQLVFASGSASSGVILFRYPPADPGRRCPGRGAAGGREGGAARRLLHRGPTRAHPHKPRAGGAVESRASGRPGRDRPAHPARAGRAFHAPVDRPLHALPAARPGRCRGEAAAATGRRTGRKNSRNSLEPLGVANACEPLKGRSQGWVTGLEPATTRSTVWSSNQLSYTHHVPCIITTRPKMARADGPARPIRS